MLVLISISSITALYKSVVIPYSDIFSVIILIAFNSSKLSLIFCILDPYKIAAGFTSKTWYGTNVFTLIFFIPTISLNISSFITILPREMIFSFIIKSLLYKSDSEILTLHLLYSLSILTISIGN